MRRRYIVSAAYLRYLEAMLVIEIANVAKDKAWRADDDPRIRRFAKVPDELLDEDLEGTVTITIDTDDQVVDVVPLPVREPMQVAS